jgi:hypothetical protein
MEPCCHPVALARRQHRFGLHPSHPVDAPKYLDADEQAQPCVAGPAIAPAGSLRPRLKVRT